jgi:bifunctional UDP-N-acetylglucosamine pyrophosphorylase / glucosamine-1-phosphate N-acetyltransferase
VMLEAQAVVLAAGLGTRMRSRLPKVLHRAAGRPVLDYVLGAVETAGCRPVTVVVGHGAELVEAAFASRGLDFARQTSPRGTGDALRAARSVFGSRAPARLLVLYGDQPLLRPSTLRALLEAHHRSDAAATLLTFELQDPGAYGRVIRAADGAVERIVEAADANPAERQVRELNAGVYVFERSPLLPALDQLQARNAQGEYYLTDVVALLRAAGQPVGAMAVEDADEALGVNTLGELAAVARRLNARRVEGLLEAGALIEDPTSTHIGPDVVVEPEAVIRPFCVLEGRTVVRGGATIGPYAHLVDVEVDAGAQILDHCLLRECVVNRSASVGPFAHVRPETVIGAGARVGNFVELKKTRLGEGSKAPHLSYLGDATIGAGVNVGAGTITCNYDGRLKHPTTIAAGAFIGSNSTLVAPITIDAGAYVAAGSVITQDVPRDALAIGRARQVAKLDWARRRREAQQEPKPRP